MSSSHMNRRSFLKTTALAGTAVSLFNIKASGSSPNDMIRHASFGASGHALRDLDHFRRHRHFELVAFAEVDENKMGEARKIFPDARIYKDWRDLLEKEGDHLDSVNVSTPDHSHAPIAATAMNMGLHVFVQKPMGHTIYETRRLTEIARERGVVTQMGIQLSSRMAERMVAAILQAGTIGKIKEIHLFSNKVWGDMDPVPDREDAIPEGLDWDTWCGPGPLVPFLKDYYHPLSWRKRQPFGTGTLGDMGCHTYSPMFQALGLDYPISVTSRGEPPANMHNWSAHQEYEYIFPGNQYTAQDTIAATWYDGRRRPPVEVAELVGGTLPDQGNVFIGTDGVMLAPLDSTPTLYPAEQFEAFRYPRLRPINFHGSFLDAVRGEPVHPSAPFDYSGPLTEAVLLGTVATHFPGEKLLWDASSLRFTNNNDANQYLRRPYRQGWEVEGLA